MASQISFTFVVYRGADVAREETVTVDVPGVVKIGRLESSHLRIEDEGVSSMHALIEVSSVEEINVIDLGSATGTMLDGIAVKKARVSDGSELRLGDARIVVKVAVAPTTAAASQQPGVPGVAPAAAPVPGGVVPGALPAGGGIPPFAGGMPGAFGAAAPVPGIGGQGIVGGQGFGQVSQAMYAAPSPDSSLDRADGSRAVEVTAMFEDDVVRVAYLDNPAGGKPTVVTMGIAGVGWVAFLAGLIVAMAGATGFGGMIILAGLAMGVYGSIRFLEEKRPPHFALGASQEADVPLANPAIPGEYFPLVWSNGRDYALLFTSAMGGDVTLAHERLDLTELVSAGRATPSRAVAEAYAYPIPNEARIKVDVGAHTFLINSVRSARPVVSSFWSRLDWSAQMSNGLSFAAHALLLFLVFAVPPDAKTLSLDLFDTDNKFVKFLVKPPQEKEDEIPAYLRKRGKDEAGGTGKRHKGEEGKMGSKKSKNKTGLYGLKGPKDNPDPHLARQLAEQAAESAGVLGVLGSSGGSHIASIFGRDTALGSDAEDALGGLIGDTIGESYGYGGLGLVGTGRGGGGTGEGTIGLGTLGTIGKGGGGSGSGSGYGRGAGRLGKRSAGVPRVLPGTAEVRGSLDKEIIRRIIRRHINEIKFCYGQELVGNNSLSGRIVVGFTIAASGRVVVSKVESSTVGSPKVEQCMVKAVRRWLFPKPKGGGIVHVTYPFVLRPAGGD